MNGAVHSTTAQEAGISGVDNSLDRLARNIALDNNKSRYAGLARAGPGLYVADLHPLPQGSQSIRALGNEFLCDKAFETGLEDCLHHGGVIELLRVVDFISARHAAGMVMGNVRIGWADALVFVAPDSADDVPFHDLHVVDVIEELEMV